MKQTEIIRMAYLCGTFVSIALAVTSCGNNSCENGNGYDTRKGNTNDATTVVVNTLEKPYEPTQEERFLAEFKSLVVLKRSKMGEGSSRLFVRRSA